MLVDGQIIFLWMCFILELNAFILKSLLTIFCIQLWRKYLLRWMLWGLPKRCYFLPIHTKYGLCSVRISVAGDAGVQRVCQFSQRQSHWPVSWSCWHLNYSDATAGSFATGVGGSRTWACPVPFNNEGFLSYCFFPWLCFPSSLLVQRCFSKRNWVAKKLLRKQK